MLIYHIFEKSIFIMIIKSAGASSKKLIFKY